MPHSHFEDKLNRERSRRVAGRQPIAKQQTYAVLGIDCVSPFDFRIKPVGGSGNPPSC
jgi:hypothetical protein